MKGPYNSTEIRGAAQKLKIACHAEAREWWTDLQTGEPFESWSSERQRAYIAEKLLLIHSELSEAVEGRRKGIQDDHLPHRPMFEVELADAAIRLFDLCGGLNIPIDEIIVEKMKYNAAREDHKIEVRQGLGGKSV